MADQRSPRTKPEQSTTPKKRGRPSGKASEAPSTPTTSTPAASTPRTKQKQTPKPIASPRRPTGQPRTPATPTAMDSHPHPHLHPETTTLMPPFTEQRRAPQNASASPRRPTPGHLSFPSHQLSRGTSQPYYETADGYLPVIPGSSSLALVTSHNQPTDLSGLLSSNAPGSPYITDRPYIHSAPSPSPFAAPAIPTRFTTPVARMASSNPQMSPPPETGIGLPSDTPPSQPVRTSIIQSQAIMTELLKVFFKGEVPMPPDRIVDSMQLDRICDKLFTIAASRPRLANDAGLYASRFPHFKLMVLARLSYLPAWFWIRETFMITARGCGWAFDDSVMHMNIETAKADVLAYTQAMERRNADAAQLQAMGPAQAAQLRQEYQARDIIHLRQAQDRARARELQAREAKAKAQPNGQAETQAQTQDGETRMRGTKREAPEY
ncbi:hypothetical protein BDV95DRAFT_330916 [Massariosphaeria phaeospora]|uniref:Uncharacterized protein n=1 Tax=Massariosphaeria phaeospora TaxID=100035 RepID=A0A7C8MBI3_9PLEO|nr:hypothetical protein BDV95DRAFT_330916 [Massariosphaeria phaeospora]